MSDKGRTTLYVLGLAAILVVIGWVGLSFADQRRMVWLIVLVLLAAFAVVSGHGVTGQWRGILIDGRNKMSLSRLQFVAWTLVVLSTILTAALTNLAMGWQTPLDFTIPSELWILMGISTASLVGAPAILSNKRDRGLVVENKQATEARWANLLMGEERGNVDHVDLGKLQMFFFTFILVVSYASAVGSMFANVEGPITELPQIQEGMNVLLGISHTGYLSNKVVAHTPERLVPSPNSPGGAGTQPSPAGGPGAQPGPAGGPGAQPGPAGGPGAQPGPAGGSTMLRDEEG